jgi:branched-chain amino acid transport system substrate-binding protein
VTSLIVAVLLGACSAEPVGRPAAGPARDTDRPLTDVVPPTAGIDAGLLFVDGTGDAAQGSALHLGWINLDNGPLAEPANTDAVEAAVAMLNLELGGIGGRPVVLRTCLVAEQLLRCAETLAADPDVVAVLLGRIGEGIDALYMALGDLPRIGIDPRSAADYRNVHAHYFALGAAGILRAAVAWSLTAVAPDAVTILAPVDGANDAETYAATVLRERDATVRVVVVDDRGTDTTLPERQISEALGSDMSPDGLIINMLGPRGCIALDRALAALDWRGQVVTNGLCSSKLVHDELGDWTAGWVHIAGGPDLARYDEDQQAALYRDRLRRYAGDDADWTGRASLSFAMVLTTTRILQRVTLDEGSAGRRAVDDAFAADRGPLFMGAGTVGCGLDATSPALCQHHARAYRYDGQRRWVDVTGTVLLELLS